MATATVPKKVASSSFFSTLLRITASGNDRAYSRLWERMRLVRAGGNQERMTATT